MPAERANLPTQLDRDLAGLDALEQPAGPRRNPVRALWTAMWPKLTAAGIGVLLWQLVVWSHWKPEYILPGPNTVFPELKDLAQDGTLWDVVATTMRRAAIGFGIALLVGTAVGSLVGSVRFLRVAVGGFITGIQNMPSIAWFPLAIVLFRISEGAITFVVVIGAAPSIANGVISGFDTIPPILRRVGRVLGARGLNTYRFVSLPAALPAFVGGIKQGWAFAWRSLLAGEIIVIIANKPSIGQSLTQSRELADYPRMMALMVVILVLGILVDAVIFGTVERRIRRRWGLAET
ncbi:MAG: ABC transporter permease [Acidimicrobiales bacterium]